MVRQITSVHHELVKHLVKLRQNHDYRYDHQRLLIEGIKPVGEVGEHLKPKLLVAWNETLLPQGMDADEIVIVNESVMKKISGMQSPEGLVAEFPLPQPASLKGKKYIIALDAVADPGNVGTLLRTALALGWEGVFLLEESCDPFNEKALRAARGATFRLPISWGNWKALKKIIQENELEPFVADLEGTSIEEVVPGKGVCLVLGNEAHGASKEARSLSKPLTIAMRGNMESLNVSVAGGIMMYALKKHFN